MNKFPNHKKILLFLFFISSFIVVFFRFYDLNWGAPYYFHPDERNVASAITRLSFPDNMNPEFFAYGSAPIYSAYFLGIAQNLAIKLSGSEINLTSVAFEQATVNLRIISASLSILIVYLIFNLLYKRLGLFYGCLGALLAGFNVGLIQYSHFGTFEIWLTFLFLLLLKLLYDYIGRPSELRILLIGIVAGILVSVKVSSLVIIPLVMLVILWSESKGLNNLKKISTYKNLAIPFFILGYFIIITIILTSPFFFLDLKSFLDSMNYESGVALGNINVFYVGGFRNTTPIAYQMLSVYPYIFNPINLIALIFSIPLLLNDVWKTKNRLSILSMGFFLIIFLSQAFFYVKWVRYYIPTIPFLILLLVLGISVLIRNLNSKHRKVFLYMISGLLLIPAFIFSFSYYKTVLLDEDTRLAAAQFARENIPSDSKIITEIYDMGIVPFNSSFPNIVLFDFYALDDEWVGKEKEKELKDLIDNSGYLILPSQRIIKGRTQNMDDFPKGNEFYDTLNSDKFSLIYKTECDIFCKILYLGEPIYLLEETSSVFDRPTVQIYKINE